MMVQNVVGMMMIQIILFVVYLIVLMYHLIHKQMINVNHLIYHVLLQKIQVYV
jgi:hypothetical protein